MLKEVYQKHLNNRKPKIGKHELDAVFEERLLEIHDERTLDLVQVMAFEIGMLRDRNERLSALLTPA